MKEALPSDSRSLETILTDLEHAGFSDIIQLPEEGKTGRLFILFVSLILSSYVLHVWNSTELHEHFSSSLEFLEEMRSSRCIEHKNKAKVIPPFTGDQVKICKVFPIEFPKGCSPDYVSKQKSTHKRPPEKK